MLMNRYGDRPAQFHVIEKNSGKIVGQYQSEPFFSFHHINAYEEDGHLLVDLANCENKPQLLEDFWLSNLFAKGLTKPNESEVRRYKISLDGSQKVRFFFFYFCLCLPLFILPSPLLCLLPPLLSSPLSPLLCPPLSSPLPLSFTPSLSSLLH